MTSYYNLQNYFFIQSQMSAVVTNDYTIEVKKSEPVIKKLISLELYTWKLDSQLDHNLGGFENDEPQHVKIR